MIKLSQIRKQRYKALIDSLDVVKMLRFLQKFEVGYRDYTKEKYQLNEPILEDFQEFVRQKNIQN